MSDEAHLPAEQSRAQAPARLPRPDGDRRRPQGAGRAPQPRPQEAVGLTDASAPIGKLTRRADFLAANGGLRAPMPGFVLLVRPRGDGDPAMRLGITVTKKIGNAVVRNRMKRRFRALARAILPEAGHRRRRPCPDRPRRRDRARLSPQLAATSCAAALAKVRAMIARLLILVARGWQIGPVADPAAELPLPAELLGLCNHRAFPLWRAARGLAGARRLLPMPPLGGLRL